MAQSSSVPEPAAVPEVDAGKFGEFMIMEFYQAV